MKGFPGPSQALNATGAVIGRVPEEDGDRVVRFMYETIFQDKAAIIFALLIGQEVLMATVGPVRLD